MLRIFRRLLNFANLFPSTPTPEVSIMSVPQNVTDALANVDSSNATLQADYTTDDAAVASVATAQAALDTANQAKAKADADVVSAQQALDAAKAQLTAEINKAYPTTRPTTVPGP